MSEKGISTTLSFRLQKIKNANTSSDVKHIPIANSMYNDQFKISWECQRILDVRTQLCECQGTCIMSSYHLSRPPSAS